MKKIHVECKPDETLVKKLGVGKKNITHHQGKSKVFHCLGKTKNELAVVDEDPGSPKTSYEKKLKFIAESYGIKQFADITGNKIFFLTGKLEDWIIEISKQDKLYLSEFGLPDNPNDLHGIINFRTTNFERLLKHLINIDNKGLKHLKYLLNAR
jgi:hypothetical protein